MNNTFKRLTLTAALLLATCGVYCQAEESTAEQKVMSTPEYRQALKEYDFEQIARCFLDFLIVNGRDTYGKAHAPLFASTLDRRTGRLFEGGVPRPYDATKPYAPSYYREVKLRGSDRTYKGANPLLNIPLYELMFAISNRTGDAKYAVEADKSIKWFMENCSSRRTGFMAWGSHCYWDFTQEGPVGGIHEYNYLWPYWDKVPGTLKRHAYALWNHQVYSKETGNYNRHANFHRHGPSGGMEFPQTGSCYIHDWASYYAESGDVEMARAIRALLGRWNSLRSPHSDEVYADSKREVTKDLIWCNHNLDATINCFAAANIVQQRDAKLADELREFCNRNLRAYFSHPRENLRDIFRVGVLDMYRSADGVADPEVLVYPQPGDDPEIGYPLVDAEGRPYSSMRFQTRWFVGRTYAIWGNKFHNLVLAMQAVPEEKQLPEYEAWIADVRQASLEIAEMYMTFEPEVQWGVWSDALAGAVRQSFQAYELTQNPAYMRRANSLARLGVDLLMEDYTPLPRICSLDHSYEANTKNGSSNEWLWQLIMLDDFFDDNPEISRETVVAPRATQQPNMIDWQCNVAGLDTPDVNLPYTDDKQLLAFAPESPMRNPDGKGLLTDGLILALSDNISRIPETIAEVHPFEINRGGGSYVKTCKIAYGGYKDVARDTTLTLKNVGDEPAKLTCTVVWNDTYHDNGETEKSVALQPGESTTLEFTVPHPRKYLRRILFTDVQGDVRVVRLQSKVDSRAELNDPRIRSQ